MRISDWSSDVCSSDLGGCRAGRRRLVAPGRGGQPHQQPGLVRLAQLRLPQAQRPDRGDGAVRGAEERTAAVGASEEGGAAAEAGAEEGCGLKALAASAAPTKAIAVSLQERGTPGG